MLTLKNLKSTFQATIFTRSYYCDFSKIAKHTFTIKVQLNILNSLLGENDINNKFLEIIRKYPETREVLPILLAVRDRFNLVLDTNTKEAYNVGYLFDKNIVLSQD